MAELELAKTEEKPKTQAEVAAEMAKAEYKKAMEVVKAERKVKADKNKAFRKAEITVMWVLFRYMVDKFVNSDKATVELFDKAFEALKPTPKYSADSVEKAKNAYTLWLADIKKRK